MSARSLRAEHANLTPSAVHSREIATPTPLRMKLRLRA